MAKITVPLTDSEIKNAKSKEKEYCLFDGEGLLLRIKPTGSKLWVFNYYRPYTRKRANISFGKYPALSLAEARKKRQTAKELLAQDIDPKEHRDSEKASKKDALLTTLSAVSKEWFEVKKKKVSPITATRIWNSIETHILTDLGEYPVTKITAPKTIETIKPVQAKSSAELARRLCQRLNEVMNYAVNVGYLHANPLTGIKAAFDSPVVKHHPTLKPEELPELMKAINYASIKIVTRCLIEWQLHTMSRPSEAAGARWEEVDFKNKLWVIPAERMKMKKEHIVPLTDETLFLLERLKPISGHREHIFPSHGNPRKPTNSETANMALKRMGFKGRLVSHGLRSLASTTLNEQGFDSDLIESALAHQDKNQVRKAYNRADYIERRRVMMEWWSSQINIYCSQRHDNHG
ncbi:DUF4102 domain-containing protein [Thalassotalea litorea]|uniref:DUF4102 domain-containing protein n=1 Tax=Thalassotalea litorea TaxID=2020715 RepID=A0A5R9IQ92_9GAMM|nr:integrase domain-containing protein [Thalassotalea litorea]TLU67700.1 DUF4102 domain-containing protein [Thalassotalea litorea]